MAGQFTAIIGLLENQPADVAAVEAALKAQIPGEASPPEIVSNSAADPAHLGYVIDFGGDNIVTVMYVEAPVPAMAIEEAVAKNAALQNTPPPSELAGITKGHYALTTVKEVDGVRQRVALAKAMTRVIAAIAQLTPTAFATWLSGASLVLQDNVQRLAESVTTGGFPTMLWTTMVPYRSPSTVPGVPEEGLVTKGLDVFVGREINFLPSSMNRTRVAERCEQIMRYLLTEGPVFNNGDTVGINEQERIRIRVSDKPGGAKTYDLIIACSEGESEWADGEPEVVDPEPARDATSLVDTEVNAQGYAENAGKTALESARATERHSNQATSDRMPHGRTPAPTVADGDKGPARPPQRPFGRRKA